MLSSVINLFWTVIDIDAEYSVDKKTNVPQKFDEKAAKLYFAHLLKRSPTSEKSTNQQKEPVEKVSDVVNEDLTNNVQQTLDPQNTETLEVVASKESKSPDNLSEKVNIEDSTRKRQLECAPNSLPPKVVKVE